MPDLEFRRSVLCSPGDWTAAAALLLVMSMAGSAVAQGLVTSQTQNSASIRQYAKFELTFSLSRTYANPFDADEADVRVVFTEPGGTQRTVPAFYYMEYDRQPGFQEQYVNGRDACWKTRFAPVRPGIHHYAIVVTDAMGTESIPGAATFACVAGTKKGFIHVDSSDPRLLRRETGEPYYPIGHNVGWAPNDTGLTWWTQHFTASGANGITWARLWMCHFYTGLNLEWSSLDGPYFHGVGRLSLEIAWKLDRVVELAEQQGMAIQLALQYHGQASSSTNSNWDRNPYNIANAAPDGGWLTSPEQFFSDAEARRLTRNKYRYIVARWGYSTAIHSWELWNEVQWTDGWNNTRPDVVAWHQEMAQFLRDIDPFHHLITTSSDYTGFDALWTIPAIDLVQMHSYTDKVLPSMQMAAERLGGYVKPMIISEFGLMAEGGIPELNPGSLPEPERSQVLEGLHLHDGIWAAFHMKSGAHLWWWDGYIEALNLFPLYKPLAIYAAGEDLATAQLSPASCQLTSAQAAGGNFLQSNTPGITAWDSGSDQTTFDVSAEGIIAEFWKQAIYLHGSWRPQNQSNPALQTNFSAPVTFRLHIAEVSCCGTTGLQIKVDGSTVASMAPANNARDLELEAQIPAGAHSVQVVNTGQDWMLVDDYGFGGLGIGGLRSVGLAGAEWAYLWIYDIGSQYGYTNSGTISDASFSLTGLLPGVYQIEFYRTWGAGGILSSEENDFSGGTLTVALPAFDKDIAVKVKPKAAVGPPHVPNATAAGAGLLCGALALAGSLWLRAT